jgi:hypothetical protein
VPFVDADEGTLRKAYYCPVTDCDAWAYEGYEPACEHEYPGKCDACETVVGDRFEELAWMGDAGWLCKRCQSYCEECDAEGVITFCGHCASCLQVVDAGGVVIWPPVPTLRLTLRDEPPPFDHRWKALSPRPDPDRRLFPDGWPTVEQFDGWADEMLP